MRVIVTGSRHHDDRELIRGALAELPPGATIVHGDARGADAIADAVACELGLAVEKHPADWQRWGRSAGMRRNAEMVAAGADLVLAFPLDDSRGTWDCVRRAKEAGISVRVMRRRQGP